MKKIKRKQIDFGGTENQVVRGDGELDFYDNKFVIEISLDGARPDNATSENVVYNKTADEIIDAIFKNKVIDWVFVFKKASGTTPSHIVKLNIDYAHVGGSGKKTNYFTDLSYLDYDNRKLISIECVIKYSSQLRAHIITSNYKYTDIRTINGETVIQNAFFSAVGDSNLDDGFYFPNAVQDNDGNWYGSVILGNQVWLAENLRTKTFNDGTHIEEGDDLSEIPAYQDKTSSDIPIKYRGLFYNWYAVLNGNNPTNNNPSGIQGLAPDGFHIPSLAEFEQLLTYISTQNRYKTPGWSYDGLKTLASVNYWAQWTPRNYAMAPGFRSELNNKTGFNFIPTGLLNQDDGSACYLWTATNGIEENQAVYVYGIDTRRDQSTAEFVVNQNSVKYYNTFLPVRCVSDLNPVQFRNWYIQQYGSLQHHIPEEIQVQSDWNQEDNTKIDYIKNKPTSVSDFDLYLITITESENSGVYSYTCDKTAKEIIENVYDNGKTPIYLFSGRAFQNLGKVVLSQSSAAQSSNESYKLYTCDLYLINKQGSTNRFLKLSLTTRHYSADDTNDTLDIVGTYDDLAADWNESNTASLAYIKNKPDIDKILYCSVLTRDNQTGEVTIDKSVTEINDAVNAGKLVLLKDGDAIYQLNWKNQDPIFVNIFGLYIYIISYNHFSQKWQFSTTQIASSGSVNDGVLTIQKNGTTIDTFSANAASNKTINITVPTQASDVSALPSSTKYAADIQLSFDDDYTAVTDTTGKNPANEGWFERSGTSTNYIYTLTEDTTPVSGKTYYTAGTYIITATLKDQDGNTLGTQQAIDLPLESVVVDGHYDSNTKNVILVLKNGSEISFSVADLVSGLQSTLVSGTNIKTINGESILGGGNIDLSGYALKSEMSITDGTDTNADKTTIQLKSGLSRQVLTQHQDISGKADKSELHNTNDNVERLYDVVSDLSDKLEVELLPTGYVIDQRGTITDPDTMVSANYYISKENLNKAFAGTLSYDDIVNNNNLISDNANVGLANKNSISWIRKHAHVFVGKWDGTDMKLRQLSDTDKTKFVDGTDATTYITNAASDSTYSYDVWLKFENDIYYRGFPLIPTGETTPNDDLQLIVFCKDKPSNPEQWEKWDKNKLIGIYKGYVDNSKAFSISGVQATNNITQTNAKAYARNRGTGFKLIDFQAQSLEALMFYALYSNLNSQACCGSGTDNTVASVYYPKKTGLCDNLGMTDTDAVNGNGASSPAAADIQAGYGTGIKSVNFMGIENWWGDIYEWMDDLQVMQARRPSSVAIANSSLYVDDYINDYIANHSGATGAIINLAGVDTLLTPTDIADSTKFAEDDKFISIRDINGNIVRIINTGLKSTEGNIAKCNLGAHGDVFTKALGGSYNVNSYCDYGSVAFIGTVALRSNSGNHSRGGVAFLYLGAGAGYSSSSVGFRLLYEGNSTNTIVVSEGDTW